MEAKNKPKVFISHSKNDIDFIKRIYADLKCCQIEPWLDSEEIRHGQPWLDAIFETGIPTCDCVLVYLSKHSIDSAMVKKEIDVSILTKLRDNRISFLPYVADSAIRRELRPDLQAIQTPEWNNNNYHELFPQVVAEIWRSFMERIIISATNDEKVKRLEAELQIERIKKDQSGIFAESEERDFQYIWESLDAWKQVTFFQRQGKAGNSKNIRELAINIHIRSIIPFLAGSSDFEHTERTVYYVVKKNIEPLLPIKANTIDNITIEFICPFSLSEELLMYGMVERRERPQRQSSASVGQSLIHSLRNLYTFVYTYKMDRFKYWLAFKGFIPDKIEWNLDKMVELND